MAEHAQPEGAVEGELFEVASTTTRIVSVLGIGIPFLGFIAAVVLLWGSHFNWVHCGLLLGMYMITAVGITVGYHRYFTHRSFQAHPAVKFCLAAFGGMAVEGPLLKWVAMHRCHHQHSDKAGDPHSPNHDHDHDTVGVIKGLFHAHMGWMFRGDPRDLYRYVPDLVGDRMLQIMSKTWVWWSLFGLLLPTVLGGLFTMSWNGALLGFIWGGLARVFLVHHVTWSINSVCHIWGSRPFRSHDASRNNFLFGLVGLGEGWHNNHHAFPTSARHGLRWWEFDASYLIIRGLEKLGLVWEVKVPGQDRIAAKAAT